MVNNISYSYQRLTKILYRIFRARHLSNRISVGYAAWSGNYVLHSRVSFGGPDAKTYMKCSRYPEKMGYLERFSYKTAAGVNSFQ